MSRTPGANHGEPSGRPDVGRPLLGKNAEQSPTVPVSCSMAGYVAGSMLDTANIRRGGFSRPRAPVVEWASQVARSFPMNRLKVITLLAVAVVAGASGAR